MKENAKFISRLKSISKEMKSLMSACASLKVESDLKESVHEHLEDAAAFIDDITEDLELENRN